MRLATTGEGGYLLVPDMQPLNRALPADLGDMISNAPHDFVPSRAGNPCCLLPWK